MFDIYFSPSRAFGRLKEKPNWLVPLVIVLVFNMLFVFISSQYIDWGKQRQAALERMRERNVPQEQIDKATEGMDKFYSSPTMRYGMPVVSALFIGVVALLFLAVIYNVSLPLFGGASDFKRTWAIVCNASLIAVPSAIVRGVLVLLKGSAEVTTSLLVVAPNLKQPFLKGLLAQLDIFDFWKFMLIAIGLKVVFGLKGSKSYTLVFAVWVVVMLLLALLGMGAGGR
ncbi:MAG: Yip1 family protein [candidate division WOR-3 bacterium]|nr:Yip1 family protein [candidate division WOR-3 bacterium]